MDRRRGKKIRLEGFIFFKRPAGSLDDDFSVSDLSKVDLLTGHSDRSVIVAPSRNFSGQHYTLSRNPARGGWEYIRNIPEIAQHLVAEGEREKTIFVFARSEARTCRDANELYDRVMKFAYSKIEDPDSFVKEHDLLSMCYRVFNWACQTPYWGGDLYGGAATASEKSYLSQKGKAGRLALILLETVILPNHGTTGLTQSFFLDTRALAKANKIEGWGRQSYRTAIVTLCSAGILLKASSPKFNVECHRNAPIHYRLKRLS